MTVPQFMEPKSPSIAPLLSQTNPFHAHRRGLIKSQISSLCINSNLQFLPTSWVQLFSSVRCSQTPPILFISLMPETKSYAHIKNTRNYSPVILNRLVGGIPRIQLLLISSCMQFIFLMSFPNTWILLRFKRFTTNT
jgi:hypothetical protein